MEKIINIQNIDPITLESQTYSPQDSSLISSFEITNTFTSSVDYIEYTVYDLNQNILLHIDNLSDYSILNNLIQIDPEKNLNTYGFSDGQYIANYNFFTNILGSSNDNKYYISEISSDKTEIRLDTNILEPSVIITETSNYIIQSEQSNYYNDFYLNFGSNQLVIANNIILDNSDLTRPTILIKLYEPLPASFDIKSELWVVKTIAEPLAYQINITLIFDNLDNNTLLRGPNLNIPVKDRINNSTEYTNYDSLINTNSIPGSSSLRYQLNSLLIEKGIEINVDYTEYSDFVFFSSAKTRLENFYYKMSLIEEYQSAASFSSGSSSGSYYVSSSYDIWQTKIDEIITNFDGYDYFLYFDSGSKSWPKTNDLPPYLNTYTTAPVTQTWLTEQYTSASYYDENTNVNNLVNTIPKYLTDDPLNEQYQLFVNMIGQHFDSIWIYIKDIDNKYNADNRLDYGVSKDLIADVLRDLGVKIYQNNFSSNDLYTSFLGITPGGSLVPPTGSEIINTYVTASFPSLYVLPDYVITGYVNGKPIIVTLDDVNKSIYKRIYHNLPYLLKKKGTVEGLRALITLYGIPDTILRINEFGGKNKDNTNDWDQWQNEANYAFSTKGTNYMSSSFSLNSVWGATSNVPKSIEFRFKPDETIPTNKSQSLWSTNENMALVLEYTSSGLTSSSYSGSIADVYNQYANLKLIPNTASPASSASINLPFFNGDWWSVLITSGSTAGYQLISKNKLYDGDDGNQIGFQDSSSISTAVSWASHTVSYFGTGSASTSHKMFSGSLQEVRYYTSILDQIVFDDYVMNPYSIEGNSINSSPNELAFRAPLGGELYTISSSMHPKVSGSWTTTSSFASDSKFHFYTTASFISNTETIFLDQPPVGIKNAINHKIKIVDTIVPSGDTLSPYITIQQDLPISSSYTRDINLLEVAFSPNDQVNQDIINQLGNFNIGEYIGDPRQLTSTNTSYPDLNKLRDTYFNKYKHNYDLTDYVRLIKYFDNSLFKMIKDFVPARTSLASGIVIKQHLLERNRYRTPSASFSEPYYTGSVKSFPYGFYSSSLFKPGGGSAGSMPDTNQSWSESIATPLGIVHTLHNDNSEFYTGELKGTELTVTTQSLAFPLGIELELVGTDVGTTITSLSNYLINYNFLPDQNYYLDFTLVPPAGDVSNVVLHSYGFPETYFNSGYLTSTVTYNFKSVLIKNSPSLKINVLNQDILSSVTISAINIYKLKKLENDPMLNNVDSYVKSQYYMDIDYSSGQLIPTNQQQLITGSATKAQVQDYYYNLNRQILPRYKGSKTTSANYNVYASGDSSYGKTAAIDKYQTYFMAFKGMSGAYPELVGKSTVYVNFLVDENGDQINVDKTGSAYYYNLIDNFGRDSNIDISIPSIEGGTLAHQSTTILREASGWPSVVLTNESASVMVGNVGTWYSAEFTAIEKKISGSTLSPALFDIKTDNPTPWSTSATSETVLTSSFEIGDMAYSSSVGSASYVQIISQAERGGYSLPAAYSQPITFRIVPGQEIRFSQDENEVCTIVSTSLSSSITFPSTIKDYTLHLFLNKSVPYFTNPVSPGPGFLIREYQVDPSQILVNSIRLISGTPGYITPQHMSPGLSANFDKTITSLKKDGII